MQDMKMQDMKMQDMKLQDMTRIDSILFNFSFFSCIVMLTLQQWNYVMWNELKKRSNDTRDKSARGVIWASNNTNDINMQH